MAQDGTCVTQLTQNGFLFTTIFTGPTGTWSLRADGAAFSNTTLANTFAFTAGPGLDGLGEGLGDDTMWMSGAIGSDMKVYALRRDGKIVRGDLITGMDPSPGTLVAALPTENSATDSNLYADIAFVEAGEWIVLRGNGELYQEPNSLTTLIDFGASGSTFVDLLPLPTSKSFGTTDVSFMALRKDGKIYRETSEDEVGDLPKSGYGTLGLSLDPPDLTTIENPPPEVAKWTAQAISGTSITVPILATDTADASEDLEVTVDTATLPVGVTYDEGARTITWADPVKGSAKVKFTVSDGVNKPVNATMSIKASDPDDNPDKNASPKVSKVKNVQGLVGIELSLPILAVDPDGDALTITVDDTLEPFTLGATFDAGTNTFLWADPALSSIGKYKVQFNVSDNVKTVKLSVTIEIVSSLLTI